jgi:ankyrin repeat protein
LIELGANLEIVGNNGLTAFSTALLSGKARRIDEFKKTGKFGRKLTENPDAMELWQHVRSGAIEQTAASIQHNPSLVGFKEAALGESALHLAILTNQEKIVELLLNNGANPDLRNDFGRTALHYAAMKGDIKLTKLLIDAKANIFALDIRGSTPLHEAAAAGATDVYHYLNKLGASDSTKNNSGFSARELYEKTTSN